MPCSFWPRHVGRSSRASSSACPRHVTLPCPKIANTPGNNGAASPSIVVRWAIRYLTIAWAVVSFIRGLLTGVHDCVRADDAGGALDGAGHIAVRRVEQRAADDQTTDVGHIHRLDPRGVGRLRIRARRAT